MVAGRSSLPPEPFDKDGLQLALSAKTFNIGKSPAFDAQLNSLIVTMGVDAIKTFVRNFGVRVRLLFSPAAALPTQQLADLAGTK
jgi:hypothetical protein